MLLDNWKPNRVYAGSYQTRCTQLTFEVKLPHKRSRVIKASHNSRDKFDVKTFQQLIFFSLVTHTGYAFNAPYFHLCWSPKFLNWTQVCFQASGQCWSPETKVQKRKFRNQSMEVRRKAVYRCLAVTCFVITTLAAVLEPKIELSHCRDGAFGYKALTQHSCESVGTKHQ